tara:strand:+ start:13 stop:231 length:219 start_codon:yes stop_codon:yes gene_type:complete
MFSKNDLVKIYNGESYDIGIIVGLKSLNQNSFFGLEEDYIQDGWEIYSILINSKIIEYDVNPKKKINYIIKI